ncbi:MAG TPA: tripartite tricarboxylate transporter TctB family protein [Microvirga sp.]|jgi:putative tricarboxylic transport membrane protein|nr:tripartite tricarboxylate transporter TctB family protein [Microvirga sp.]
MTLRSLVSANKVAGGFFLLLGLGAVAGAVGLQIGTPREPQPGFFPFLAGLGLAFLSGLLIIQDARGRSLEGEPFADVRRPLLAVLALIAFVVLLDPIGYVLATTALATALLLVLGGRLGWGTAALIIVLAVGSYGLFDRLLNVPLPKGKLAMMLGL